LGGGGVMLRNATAREPGVGPEDSLTTRIKSLRPSPSRSARVSAVGTSPLNEGSVWSARAAKEFVLRRPGEL